MFVLFFIFCCFSLLLLLFFVGFILCGYVLFSYFYFVGFDFYFFLQFDSCIVGIGTLRKQTFTLPWAIVRRSPLQSAKHTEDANVRPPLGDRSPKPSQ